MFELRLKDCAESIAYGVGLTQGWRDKKAAEYFDPRNAFGAKCLAKLATDAAGLSEAQYLQLRDAFEEGGPRWRGSISKAARDVGFRHKIKDFPSFIERLVEALNEPVSA